MGHEDTKTRRRLIFVFAVSRNATMKPPGYEEHFKLKCLLRVFVAIDATGYRDAAESSRVRVLE
jgi:hypothetical protein